MNHHLIDQVQQAINYMEAHLLEDIAIEDVAQAAYMSKSTLYVVFSRLLDSTLKDYIRKRRLTLSATDLACTDLRVLDIAVKYGFGSGASYGRAFRKLYGVTPAQFRKSPGFTGAYPRVFLQVLDGSGGKIMIGKHMNEAEVRAALKDLENGYVLDIDIDQFQSINETYGWAIGDKVLIGVPDRVNAVLQEMKLETEIIRIAGDEYVVILKDMTQENVEVFASKAIAQVGTGFDFDGQHVPVTISIGISRFSVETSEADILKQTEEAMKQAKRNGRDQYAIL